METSALCLQCISTAKKDNAQTATCQGLNLSLLLSNSYSSLAKVSMCQYTPKERKFICDDVTTARTALQGSFELYNTLSACI